MCQHNSNCGCGCQVVQSTGCSSSCCSKTKTDNIVYSGPNLSCLGIMLNSDLTTIIQQLTTAVCANTTTSTTTLFPVSEPLIWEAKLFLNGPDEPTITVLRSTLGETSVGVGVNPVTGSRYDISLGGISAILGVNTIITNSNLFDQDQDSIYFVVVTVTSSDTLEVLLDNSETTGEIGILVKHYLSTPNQPVKSNSFGVTIPYATSGPACSDFDSAGLLYVSTNTVVGIGTVVFEDPGITTLFDGGNQWYGMINDNDGRVIQIDSNGIVTDLINCF